MSDDLERRLRDSLRAYAQLVDAPDDDALPVRGTEARPLRRWRGALLAAAAAAAVVTGSFVLHEDRHPAVESATGTSVSVPAPSLSAAPEGASGTASDQALAATVPLPPSPEPGVAYAVDLFTHCGVRGLDINGVWFAADPPLVEDDSPPPGWENPDQPGTVTLLSTTNAVFADAAGHQVRLRADESARPEPCD